MGSDALRHFPYLVFDNVAAHALGLNDLMTPWFMMDKL
jgi:hypothetical protein